MKKADAEKLEYGEAVYFANKVKHTLRKNVSIHLEQTTDDIEEATKFNTKEEAEQFTNPLMEVVEVEDD